MQPPTSFALEAWVSLHLAIVYHMRTVCSESFALRRETCQFRNTYTRTSLPFADINVVFHPLKRSLNRLFIPPPIPDHSPASSPALPSRHSRRRSSVSATRLPSDCNTTAEVLPAVTSVPGHHRLPIDALEWDGDE